MTSVTSFFSFLCNWSCREWNPTLFMSFAYLSLGHGEGEDWYSNMCTQFYVIGMYKASVKSMQVFVHEASILILLVGGSEHHVNKIMTLKIDRPLPSPDHICPLLSLYRQNHGYAMSSLVCPIVANFDIEDVETKALTNIDMEDVETKALTSFSKLPLAICLGVWLKLGLNLRQKKWKPLLSTSKLWLIKSFSVIKMSGTMFLPSWTVQYTMKLTEASKWKRTKRAHT